MTTKETLHQIVEGLSEKDAEDLLDYLNMRADPDTLTAGEIDAVEAAEAEIARGEYITLNEIQHRLRTQ
ncbi:MAG: hypothetical protein ACR2PL_12455 [Dehalococcoidia bacterium]